MKKALTSVRKNGISIIFKYMFLKHVYRLKPIVSPILFESINMYLRLGYWPNLKKPRTLNEKIVYQKLFTKKALFTIVADKYKVRDYVANKVGESILNEIYFVGNDAKKVNFDILPNKFVIKANHGSGWNFIVKDKSSINQQNIIDKCNSWLKQKYSINSNGYETHYDNIQPLVLFEKYLYGISEIPFLDYKFFCFRGIVKFIAVDTEKEKTPNRNIYDTNWNNIEFSWPDFPKKKSISKPSQLAEMVKIAEVLSKEFEFCRIDLYLSTDGIKFGEITLTPGSGWDKISPQAWDRRLGDFW